jgi:cytochrome P450
VTAVQAGPRTDPRAWHKRLRVRGSVHLVPLDNGLQTWLIVGYDEARRALADGRLVKDPAVVDAAWRAAGSNPPAVARELSGRNLLNSDPPEHSRLRQSVAPVFSARSIDAAGPAIQALTNELLDAIGQRDEAELIRALALPLPVRVICMVLGIPRSRLTAVEEWAVARMERGAGASTLDRRRSTTLRVLDIVDELVASPRPRGSLGWPMRSLLDVSALMTAPGPALSVPEARKMLILLLISGHETTVHLISNSLGALLGDPDVHMQVQRQPNLIPAALDEVLRRESPVQYATQRVATEDMTFGETTIPAGSLVSIAIGAANRDPAAFADPDRIHLGRRGPAHLAFGRGRHFCLGASLARLEAEVAIAMTLRRFPRLSLALPAAELTWRSTGILLGLEALPVRGLGCQASLPHARPQPPSGDAAT